MAEFDASSKIEEQFTKEEFFRQVLIDITYDVNTPIDVLSSEFGEVNEYEDEILALCAKVTVDFSCSAGYDREEEYLATEKFKDSPASVEKERIVTKKRVVTDWRPYHTVETFDTLSYAFNGEGNGSKLNEQIDISEACARAIQENRGEFESVKGEYVENSGLFAAQSVAEFSAYEQLNIPGDRQKGENAHYDTEYESLICFLVPRYTLYYKYGGEEYEASGFAAGNPSYAFGHKPKTVKSADDAAKQATQKYKVAFIIACVLAAIGFVAGGLSMNFSDTVMGIALGAMGIFIVAAIVIQVLRNKAISKILNDVKEQKISALRDTLKKYGLRPLSDEDLKAGKN